VRKLTAAMAQTFREGRQRPTALGWVEGVLIR
jgi:hypothetical protein